MYRNSGISGATVRNLAAFCSHDLGENELVIEQVISLAAVEFLEVFMMQDELDIVTEEYLCLETTIGQEIRRRTTIPKSSLCSVFDATFRGRIVELCQSRGKWIRVTTRR